MEEYLDLWRTVAEARDAALAANGATAANLLMKDGPACGAAVPHLHVHVVPRVPGDFVPNDKVFSLIDGWAPSHGDKASRSTVVSLDIPSDSDRKDRTFEMMAKEASTYRRILGTGISERDHTFGKFSIDRKHIFAESSGGHAPAVVCSSSAEAIACVTAVWNSSAVPLLLTVMQADKP